MSVPRRFDWLVRPHLADEDQPLSAEARFAAALSRLPAVERSALALSEIGGLDAEEIAERLGTDPSIVRKLLARARESVRESIALHSSRGLGGKAVRSPVLPGARLQPAPALPLEPVPARPLPLSPPPAPLLPLPY
jgi:predicted DNA-binding protein (UPF0251 family)